MAEKTEVVFKYFDVGNLTAADIRKHRLTNFEKALKAVLRSWQKKFPDYPCPVRVLVFFGSQNFWIEYLFEFADFPSVGGKLASDLRNRLSVREFSNMVRSRVSSEIHSLARSRGFENTYTFRYK